MRECLRTGWVSSAGTFVERFEKNLANYLGGGAAVVAVINGTAALHIALKLVGVGANDRVIVPAITFIASANAVRYLGAEPVFVDVDEQTGQIDSRSIEQYLADHCETRDGACFEKRTGRRIAAILPVHLLGHAAPIDVINALAGRYGVRVVEDAAEAMGTQYAGQPVGHGSAMAVLSFNGNKTITTGGGGALVTTNRKLAERARYLTTQAKLDAHQSIHGEVGHNYRLSNLAAALGVSQLEHLDELVTAKRAIGRRYIEALADVPGMRVIAEPANVRSSYWLNTIRIDSSVAGYTSRELGRALVAAGIESRPLWQPMHRSPAFADIEPRRDCPVADLLYDQALSIPSSAGLSAADQQRVIDTIRTFAHSHSTEATQ